MSGYFTAEEARLLTKYNSTVEERVVEILDRVKRVADNGKFRLEYILPNSTPVSKRNKEVIISKLKELGYGITYLEHDSDKSVKIEVRWDEPIDVIEKPKNSFRSVEVNKPEGPVIYTEKLAFKYLDNLIKTKEV